MSSVRWRAQQKQIKQRRGARRRRRRWRGRRVRRWRRRRLVGAHRNRRAGMVEHQPLLAGAQEPPIFGNHIDVRTWPTIGLWLDRDASMEELTSCECSLFVTDADCAPVAGKQPHARVVAHHERHRVAVAESKHVGRARGRNRTRRHHQPRAARVAVHRERHAAFFDAELRHASIAVARRQRRRKPATHTA